MRATDAPMRTSGAAARVKGRTCLPWIKDDRLFFRGDMGKMPMKAVFCILVYTIGNRKLHRLSLLSRAGE